MPDFLSEKKFPETMDGDLPFLSVFKDGVLVESMCLHGLDSVVFGRHSNCDLMVTHPSVSRHHLEMRILHGSRELLLTDLDSVHGTWINGEQLLPLVPATVKEGDSFKLGASSRLYSVKWLHRSPQSSTSSQESSENSDLRLPLVGIKGQQGPTGTNTTVESKKSSQLHANNVVQSTNSISCNKDGDKVNPSKRNNADQGSESSVNVLNEGKGVCISHDKQMATVTQDGKSTAESQPIGAVRSPIEKRVCNFENEKWSESLDEDKIVSCSFPGDQIVPTANVRLEDSKDTAACGAKCDGKNDFNSNLRSFEEKPVVTQTATQPQNSKSRFHQVKLTDSKRERQSQTEKSTEDANLSKLWVRRSKSNPPPNLLTSMSPSIPLPLQQEKKKCSLPSAPPMPLSYLVNNFIPSVPPLLQSEKLSTVDVGKEGDKQFISNLLTMASEDAKENSHCVKVSGRENSGDYACHDQPMQHGACVDEYISDKENSSPGLSHANKQAKPIKGGVRENCISQEKSQLISAEGSRMPFQPLPLTAQGGSKPFSLAHSEGFKVDEGRHIQLEKKLHSPVIQNLNLQLTSPKGTLRSETRYVWHIVTDIGCFLDPKSFKSLQQLEGIREVQLIIPKIVISELSCLRKGMGRLQNKALSWIESCMVKLPTWIHVQSSSETMPVAATPPVSPMSALSFYGGSFENIVSPTNGDHALNCALVFNNNVSSGKVVLLTNDIALKIKTMAEGLHCEVPCSFCESLLNPYSGRFLWANRNAHRHSWTEKHCQISSCSALAPSVLFNEQSTKEVVMSTVKAMSFRKHRSVESLRRQCCKQAHGLKAALPQ